MPTDLKSKRTKTHQKYKRADGAVVPGVTTIIGLLDKSGPLVHWAWKLGSEGQDYRVVRDKAASIGSLAHEMISSHLQGIECDTSEYTAEEIDKASNSFLSYLEWEKGHTIEPILIETPLVSEVYQFGGTLDLLAKIDGEVVLLDYKTGGLYDEILYQLSALRELCHEAGYPEIGKAIALGIPRSEDDSFQEKVFTKFDVAFNLFCHLLKVYQLKKQIKGGG